MRIKVLINKHGFRAFDKTGRELVDAMPTAEPLDVEVALPAEVAFDRHVAGVLVAVADALHTTPEMVRAKLLYGTGNYQLLGKNERGNDVIAISGTSRSALADPALRAFWSEAKEIIVSDLLPCIKNDAERRRVEQLLSLEPA